MVEVHTPRIMAHSIGAEESPRVLYVNDDHAFADLVRAKFERIASDISLTIETDTETALSRLSAADIDCLVTAYSLSEAWAKPIRISGKTASPSAFHAREETASTTCRLI